MNRQGLRSSELRVLMNLTKFMISQVEMLQVRVQRQNEIETKKAKKEARQKESERKSISIFFEKQVLVICVNGEMTVVFIQKG